MFLINIISEEWWNQLVGILQKIDTDLFIKINNEWTNTFLDNNYPWWRDSIASMPFYLFLLLFILMNFGWKAWQWILFILLTVTITDQLSSTVFKEWINRLRPCNDPFMINNVRLLLNHCPASQSFTSSHATNHFGAAVFINCTLKPYIKKWRFLLFFWAATISYGQIYVGVHYPLDVVGGAIIGSLTGWLMAKFFNFKVGMPALV